MREFKYYLYMMSNRKHGTIYTGITNDLQRRVLEHKKGVNEGFTKRYNLGKLVYYEEHKYINNVRERERQIKAWKRQWKIRLIEEDNPEWEDLAGKWYFQDELE